MLAEQTHATDQTELQDADAPITVDEFAQFVREAINQPPWRANADKEADYADGNQLDSDLLKKQAALGIPPAKENIIGPAIRSVCGYEAKTRTDWRVTPDSDPGGQDVADALNYRLNQAERHSHADRALSDAFRPAATVGIGWVEVTRASDRSGSTLCMSHQISLRCTARHLYGNCSAFEARVTSTHPMPTVAAGLNASDSARSACE